MFILDVRAILGFASVPYIQFRDNLYIRLPSILVSSSVFKAFCISSIDCVISICSFSDLVSKLLPSNSALNTSFCFLTSDSILSLTYSKALIKNPPEPHVGSQITSPSCGSSISVIKSTIVRGVKNCPSSPRNVVPKNCSNAIPLTSS